MNNPSAPALRPTAGTWVMLLALGALWGGSFFFARIAVLEVPPLWLVFLRVSIAASALHLYLVTTGHWHKFRATPFAPFILLGLLNNALPFSLMFAGQTAMGAGLASILNATTPFLTVIVAQMMTADEKASPRKIAGTLLGLAGAVIVIGPSAAGSPGAPLWAQMCLIGTATSYAFASVYAKRFKQVPPMVTATGQLSASTILILPLAMALSGRPDWASWSADAWLAVLGLALASTALAYTLYFRIVAAAGATFISLVTLIIPAFAILLGFAFLGERLTTYQLFGMAVIAAGLWLMNHGYKHGT